MRLYLRVKLNERGSSDRIIVPRGREILYREFMSDTDDIFVWNRSPSRKWKIPNEICATAGGLLIRRVSTLGIYARPEAPGSELAEKFSYWLNETVLSYLPPIPAHIRHESHVQCFYFIPRALLFNLYNIALEFIGLKAVDYSTLRRLCFNKVYQ